MEGGSNGLEEVAATESERPNGLEFSDLDPGLSFLTQGRRAL